MTWIDSWIIELIILTITFWTALYFYFTRDFNYWKERKIPFIRPVPFFGVTFPILTQQKSIGDVCKEIYDSTTEPFIGFFICDEPCLLVRDIELVKSILVKDFGVWNNRMISENKRDDPMGSHILFVLKTPDWREIRRKISPAFTTGRMKLMYTLMQDVGAELIDYMKKEVAKNPIVDIREVSQKYTTDAITTTAFGIHANCFKYEDAEFRQVSRRIYNWAVPGRGISITCHYLTPALVKLFKLRFIDTFSADFLRGAFWKTMNEREENKIVRNDLLDLLIDMKNQEKIDDPYRLEGEKLVAQATNFFMAGHETSSGTICFTLYELAINKDIQEKVKEEVVRVRNKHGEFSYNALKEMEYLDMCIKETLRKYPILPFLDRRCNTDYQIPGTDVVLKKGTALFISCWGSHMDPKYFPNPTKYDPTRFTEENMKSRSPFVYLPFGEGPRNCIGARFGSLSSKCCVAHIISEFEVDLCQETEHPIKIDPKGFMLAPILELPLRFTKYE